MYVYELHLGGLYTTEFHRSFDECYCEQCGDYDWEIGSFHNPQDFLKYYANNIDCDDNNGGYHIDDIFEDVLNYFEEKISRDDAVKIVQDNRTWEEDLEE